MTDSQSPRITADREAMKSVHETDVVVLATLVGRLREELAARPAEAHVLRRAAVALENEGYSGPASIVLGMANEAERAASLRPWQGETSKREM